MTGAKWRTDVLLRCLESCRRLGVSSVCGRSSMDITRAGRLGYRVAPARLDTDTSRAVQVYTAFVDPVTIALTGRRKLAGMSGAARTVGKISQLATVNENAVCGLQGSHGPRSGREHDWLRRL